MNGNGLDDGEGEGAVENGREEGTSEEEDDQNKIEDMTEKDLINLRRTIYLVIMSSVDF